MSGPLLNAALIAQAAKRMQIDAFMVMLKQAKEELKHCNAAVKRERELEREHKKKMLAVAKKPERVVRCVTVRELRAPAKKKAAKKKPNFKRPRGGAPKSEVAGIRKRWDYDLGGWKEPQLEQSLAVMSLSDAGLSDAGLSDAELSDAELFDIE
jgi:hypothetical protein